MKKNENRYIVFEHEALYLHRGEQKLSAVQLKALQLFFKEKEFPYYTLVHNGIRFCEYVGVIKIGNLTIEVLPKADKTSDDKHWRGILIDMIRSVGLLNPDAPSYSNLKIKNVTVLDMYLDLFIVEVERLTHQGLIKKYRKAESNCTALKGKLLIGKQITKNVIHQERFYTEHTIYDHQHRLHQILYKALKTVIKLGSAAHLMSRYQNVLIGFPDQKDIKINENLFEQIHYDRKSKSYQTAVEIAKIILLNYHPDLSQGSNHVLALMFDMNKLWEKFVLKSLQRNLDDGFEVSGQVFKEFWKPENGYAKRIKPDIVIKQNGTAKVVLDTKWKNIRTANPSDDDLRQLYAYSRYHANAPSYLVYPGEETTLINGIYNKVFDDDQETPGGIVKLRVTSGKREGMGNLCTNLTKLIKLNINLTKPGVRFLN